MTGSHKSDPLQVKSLHLRLNALVLMATGIQIEIEFFLKQIYVECIS